MKPYKILNPNYPLWVNKTIKASISEKKIIKMPLKLILNCNSFKNKLNNVILWIN